MKKGKIRQSISIFMAVALCFGAFWNVPGTVYAAEAENAIEKTVNQAYLSLPSSWSETVYCYAYDSETEKINNGEWPGVKMEKDDVTGYFVYEIPENIEKPRVIFYNSDVNRYPADMEKGFLFETDGKWLFKDNKWEKYQLPVQISFAEESVSYRYDGAEKKPAVIVTEGTKTLTENTEYKLRYENNINACADGVGEEEMPAVIVTGIGAYADRMPVNNRLTFFIEKAEKPGNAPADTMKLPEGTAVKDVPLPEDWEWVQSDLGKNIHENQTIVATAVYHGTDRENYKAVTVTVQLTGNPCEHIGGTATCISGAECEKCGRVYGEIDSTNHKNITIRNQKEADSTQDGYTGDTVCIDCGTVISYGKLIPKTGGGDEILEAGEIVTDTASKAVYKITRTGSKGNTVEYVAPAGNAAVVKIPETILVKGNYCKVTAIGDGAFLNNKTLKMLEMSDSIQTIGKKAFYKCSRLTRIKISSSVNKIGSKAFFGCRNLKKIVIATNSLTNKSIGSKAFKGIAAKAVIQVPKKKLSAYKKILRKKGVGTKVKIRK